MYFGMRTYKGKGITNDTSPLRVGQQPTLVSSTAFFPYTMDAIVKMYMGKIGARDDIAIILSTRSAYDIYTGTLALTFVDGFSMFGHFEKDRWQLVEKNAMSFGVTDSYMHSRDFTRNPGGEPPFSAKK